MTNQSLNLSSPPFPWGDAKPWCHHPVLDWSKFAGTHQDKVSIYSKAILGTCGNCINTFVIYNGFACKFTETGVGILILERTPKFCFNVLLTSYFENQYFDCFYLSFIEQISVQITNCIPNQQKQTLSINPQHIQREL